MGYSVVYGYSLSLDVALVPRDPAVNHINEVINQTYEYGISDSAFMLYVTRGENVVIV